MKLFSIFWEFLRKPILGHVGFICAITLLLCIPDFWFFVNDGESPILAIYLIFQAYIWAYGISGIICLLKNRYLQLMLKLLALSFVSIEFLLESTSVFQHGERFNPDFLYILLGTNGNEVEEYIETFASPSHIGSFIFSMLLIIASFWIVIKEKYCHPVRIQNIFLLVLLLGVIVMVRRSVITEYNLYSKILSYTEYKVPPNLHTYYKNPALIFDEEDLPQNVVVIFGESLTKYHCSLYGYNKETNPLLTQLKDKDSLIVFKNVTSPGTSTVQSFRYMMGTHKENDGREWFDCIFIPEIIEKAGYKSHWISNQAALGMYDNVIRRYAELCSDFYFNGDMFTGGKRQNTYDGDLIDVVKRTIKKDSGGGKYFTFINLMGSHFKFNRRYPPTFSHFKEDDYLDKMSTQRQTIAEYDNSVFYNDYVVYELLKAYDEKEAIILYFPDHGIDLYYTKDDHASHALNTPTSQRYGKAIPFIIYTTSRFQLKFPNIVDRLRKSVDNDFCTGDLIYALMDIMGIRFKNNNDVESYSPFTPIDK